MMKKESTSTNKANGIYFCGVVSQRRRRKVPKDNPTATVVTYEFSDEMSHSYYVDDYEPEKYYEVGEYIEVPIRIKAYMHKTANRPAYSMTIKRAFDKTNDENGEIF